LIPIGLPSTLLTRRPDIRRAERDMAAATARTGVSRADLYPKFALTGFIDYSSTHGVDGHPAFFVGPTVSWPIFSGWRISSNIDASDARLEQAILGYRSTVLTAFEEVENALTAYAKESIRRETLAKAAHEAEVAAGLAQTEYRTGLVDFLNVLEAQSTLAASQQALALSEQTLLTDLVAIYKALGGGWETFEDGLAERESHAPQPVLPR
jgi:outer membrane protein TolC